MSVSRDCLVHKTAGCLKLLKTDTELLSYDRSRRLVSNEILDMHIHIPRYALQVSVGLSLPEILSPLARVAVWKGLVNADSYPDAYGLYWEFLSDLRTGAEVVSIKVVGDKIEVLKETLTLKPSKGNPKYIEFLQPRLDSPARNFVLRSGLLIYSL